MEIAAVPRFIPPTQTPRFLPPVNVSSSSCFLKRPSGNCALTKPSTLFRDSDEVQNQNHECFVVLCMLSAYIGLWARCSPTSSSTTAQEALPSILGLGNASAEKPDFQEPSADKDKEETREMLDKLPLKLGSDESYSIFLYGAGALVSVWFSSIVVGALETIPVFPQLMEVVGLSYTIWFSYRYLLFKKRRDELAGILAELREKILGLSDD